MRGVDLPLFFFLLHEDVRKILSKQGNCNILPDQIAAFFPGHEFEKLVLVIAETEFYQVDCPVSQCSLEGKSSFSQADLPPMSINLDLVLEEI